MQIYQLLSRMTKRIGTSSKTTEIYTHVSKSAIGKIKNPIDDFFE